MIIRFTFIVFISYGTKCNDELLEKYGFILEDNEDQCVHIDFNSLMAEVEAMKAKEGISDAEKAIVARKEALLLDQMEGVTDYSYQILPSAVTQEVIFASEILSYAEGDTPSDANLHRIQWLIKTVSNLISKYPKSTDEDEALIESPTFQKISRRARMAIKLRYQERELLENVLAQYKQVEDNILGRGVPKNTDKEEL